MPPEIASSLSIVIALIAAFGTVAFVIAFVGNKNRGLSEVQNSTITALQVQNEMQEKQIKALEKKVTYFTNVLLTVEYALKRRGLRIERDEDVITLIDERSRASQTVQIRMMDALHNTEESDKEA